MARAWARYEVIVREFDEGKQARIPRQCGQARFGGGSRDAVQDLFAFRILASPGQLVALARFLLEFGCLFEEALDLVRADDVAYDEVASGTQEVRHLFAITVELEALGRIEGRTVDTLQWVGLSPERPTIVERAKQGFEADESDRIAFQASGLAAIDEAWRGARVQTYSMWG